MSGAWSSRQAGAGGSGGGGGTQTITVAAVDNPQMQDLQNDWLNRYPMPTVLGIVVWQWTPFKMLIILAGLQSQDLEVLEAAQVDGAGLISELTRIVLPTIMPGLAATVLICVIFAWNEFFYAVNLTSQISPTSPIFLVGFISGRGLFFARLSAAAPLACLPVILAGWVAQKQLIRGLTMGAVK